MLCDCNFEVCSFPIVSFRPEEGEDNALAWREARGFYVSVVDSEPSINSFRICYGFPTVSAPVDSRRHEDFDSKIPSMWDCSNLLVEPPCGMFRTGPLGLLSHSGLWWHVEDLSFTDRSCEFDVFRVRPDEGHSRACGTAVMEPVLRNIFRVPDLFRN